MFKQPANNIMLGPKEENIIQDTQVVPSISVSFQNRFALLPISGWPYPAIQHMAGSEAEIRMSLACVSQDDGEGNPLDAFKPLEDIQRMMHIMDVRAREYRKYVASGRDIFLLNKVDIADRFLNLLGIRYVVPTDLSIGRDPDASNMVRAELVMHETGLVDEEVTGYLQKSDKALLNQMREFIVNGSFRGSNAGPALVSIAERLKTLWEANETAFSTNNKALNTEGFREALGSDPQSAVDTGAINRVFGNAPVGTALGALDFAGLIDLADGFAKINLNTAQIPVGFSSARQLQNLNEQPVETLETLDQIKVPLNPSDIFDRNVFSVIGLTIQGLIGIDSAESRDFLTGAAEKYRETSQGERLVETWQEMQRVSLEINRIARNNEIARNQTVQGAILRDFLRPDVNAERSIQNDLAEQRNLAELQVQWVQAWIVAHYEWWQDNIFDPLAYQMFRQFQEDPALRQVVANLDAQRDRRRGIYRDLLLEKTPEVNPYSWLDDDLTSDIRREMNSLIDRSLEQSEQLIDEYGKDEQELGFNFFGSKPRRGYVDAGADNREKDNDALVNTPELMLAKAAKAIQAISSDAKRNIRGAYAGIKNLNPVQFTARKAFPAFRLYFVEEDNQGLIRRFDDFYSYNAITDINLISYKDRPATCVIQMTNLFGHLDGKIFDEFMYEEQMQAVYNQAKLAGNKLPTFQREVDGIEQEVNADGSTNQLRNLLLQPGTKIVLKMGYDNNPDRLETVFSGQITEITTGDLVTIIAQDWTSELLGAWDQEFLGDPMESERDFLGRQVRALDSRANLDPQGIGVTRVFMREILRSKQVRHFGHWQVGPPDPFSFDGRTWQRRLLASIAGQFNITGRDRSLENVNPAPRPWYSAFGTTYNSVEPTYKDRSLWETIQELRLRHPNDIVMVRPYGQGDATLYFGQPYGTYRAENFDDADATLIDEIYDKDEMFEIFKEIINNSETVDITGLQYVFRDGRLQRFFGKLFNDLNLTDGRDQTQETPVWMMLTLLSPEIFKNSRTGWEAFGQEVLGYLEGLGKLNPQGFVSSFLTGDNLNSNLVDLYRNRQIKQDGWQPLAPNAPDKVQRTYFEALLEMGRLGWKEFPPREQLISYVGRNVLKTIKDRIRNNIIRENDEDDPLVRTLNSIEKPVRKWHIVTSSHHIVSNNIALNTTYANRVQVGDAAVSFDPGVFDLRTKQFQQNFGEQYEGEKGLRSFLAASLLADEMRRMYRGQLVVTGNPEIQPHDIVLVLDYERSMIGPIEVDKVQHVFSQDNGFISIITPAMVTEIGDMTTSAALQGFVRRLGQDIMTGPLNRENTGILGAGVSRGLGLLFQGAALQGEQISDRPTNGVNLATQVINWTSFALINTAASADARLHAVNILPLSFKGYPWVAGLEGASGRTFFGVQVQKTFRRIRDYSRVLDTAASRWRDAKNIAAQARDIANQGILD